METTIFGFGFRVGGEGGGGGGNIGIMEKKNQTTV